MIKNNKNFIVAFLMAVSFAQCTSAISKDEAISFAQDKADKTLKFAKEHKKKLIAAAIPAMIGMYGVYVSNSSAKDSGKSIFKKFMRYSLSPLSGLIVIGDCGTKSLIAGAKMLNYAAESLIFVLHTLDSKLGF